MLEKAKIKVEGKKEAISVMFNPNEYSVSHTASLQTEPETDTANPSFNGLTLDDFVVVLIFDS
jgi:hypothetical protein